MYNHHVKVGKTLLTKCMFCPRGFEDIQVLIQLYLQNHQNLSTYKKHHKRVVSRHLDNTDHSLYWSVSESWGGGYL